MNLKSFKKAEKNILKPKFSTFLLNSFANIFSTNIPKLDLECKRYCWLSLWNKYALFFYFRPNRKGHS